MTDLTQVIRWNTGFIRGLAQSVLEHAKTVRGSLTGYKPVDEPKAPSRKAKSAGPSASAKKPRAAKRATKSASKSGRGKKTLNG
jgi:hypothetical protein